jgi:hypothetical protein
MDKRQSSKCCKLADKMEHDLNRSLRQRGSDGRPSHVESPHSTPFVEPATVQTLPSNKPGLLSTQSAPPPEGIAAPVMDAPTLAHIHDGSSYSDQRGAYPKGYEHGECYGSRLTTRYNSSLVDDDEAASRAEWLYQSQEQTSRTASYEDPYSHPFHSTRGSGFGCLLTAERERASPSRSFSIESRVSWQGWSVIWWPRLPPSGVDRTPSHAVQTG